MLDNASFTAEDGKVTGFLGSNGAGKSTLLKIAAGMEEPDEGSVTRANHVVVRFLSQQPVFEPEDTILESVLKGNEKSLPVGRGSDEEKGHGEWELESQAKSMLTRLGVTDFGQKAGNCPAGRKRGWRW